ncbi:ATP-binding protein [Bosea sp. BK604]|uniref:sensor histidine kinase n=1 Tax=Bosea sp. BK604 TaxID=2512180 RepID=UPI001050EC7B|nr:ATP-binding protein [Bosea sp. BK604]
MSEAGQDWAWLGTEAAKDAALAPFAVGGALFLWDQEAARPGFGNAAARALLGRDWDSAPLPLATRDRLKLLAGGLASHEALRLERLRLKPGFTAALVTCGCKLFSAGSEPPILAITIAASELRRLGVAAPAAAAAPTPEAPAAAETPATATPAPAPQPESPAAAAPAMPKRATVRFLWQCDAAGRFTSVSPDIAEVIGSDAAASMPGRTWSELIGREIIDQGETLPAKLAGSATWSGYSVLWRTADPSVGVRVELSGVPVLDADRNLTGFRGFGLARMTERESLPEIAVPAAAEFEPTEDEPAPSVVESTSEAVAETASEELVEASQELMSEADRLEEANPPNELDAPDLALGDSEAAAEASDEGDVPPATEPEPEPEATPEATSPANEPRPGANVVPLRNGHLTAVRPVLEPSKPLLSSAERNAFREIAKALGARIAGEEGIESRLPPAAPLNLGKRTPASEQQPLEEAGAAEETVARIPPEPGPSGEAASEASEPVAEPLLGSAHGAPQEEPALALGRPRLPNSHADVLDRLPIAVLVNRGEEPLYANRTLLDLLDYADLADLASKGGVSRLIKGAARAEGGPMVLIDRLGHLLSVDAKLSSISWLGEAATLMAFRHPDGGGEIKEMTPEEAEEAELAAEFAAEEEEISARVDALRLDIEAREARIGEMMAVLDTATDGVVTIDERGRILSLNKTAEALFGYDQREVTGELFTLLFAPESHGPALDYLEGLKGGGVASVMNDGREIAGRVRQGGRIPLFMTMGQIADGAERRFCAVLRDITAWKKTEGELVEARKAAEKASAQKSDVLAKISHEIRTPLNAIIGFAEVMAEERFGPIANERYKEYLRDIHQSGGYVISLVNDLLDLAKIEAGKLDLDFVSVNLNEIALSAVSLLQPEAQRGRVVLRSGLSPKLPPVVADERSIRQIVINLLSNAVKFTDAGGQVIVSTALGDQGEAILRVRDTGIGMDDSEIALALEPFRQVPTTRKAGGTGLGLPLTKALVEANRAAMTITSVKKEGTLVEITFPPQRVLAG